MLISGEDLAHFCEIILDLMCAITTNKEPVYIYGGNTSEMLRTALKARAEPFFDMKKKEFNLMADFIGGIYIENPEESDFILQYKPFPKSLVTLKGANHELKYELSGQNIKKIRLYDIERMVIMCCNHCLRYMKDIFHPKRYKIIDLMFSGYYKKKYPEKFE
ncbi:MAG: hypothetical protein GF364_21400 [Candidatus Lokiarchaeota archaeon]|nr:hypothetical protein [Candidatus Lokiarchaeota archaeon]